MVHFVHGSGDGRDCVGRRSGHRRHVGRQSGAVFDVIQRLGSFLVQLQGLRHGDGKANGKLDGPHGDAEEVIDAQQRRRRVETTVGRQGFGEGNAGSAEGAVVSAESLLKMILF